MDGGLFSVFRPTLLAAVAGAALAVPAPAAADGEFLQFDLAPRASSLTATVRRDRLTATLGWSEFETGETVSLWGSYGLAVGEGAWLRIGPAARLDDAGRSDPGLRAGLERFAMSERWTTFALAEFTTIQREYLLLGQAGHIATGIAGEVAVQGNHAGFRERSLAVSYRVGDGPVRLRLGYRFQARRAFAGFSVNTF